MVRFDRHGICTTCGLPGSGFVEDGVCECLDREYVEMPLDRVRALIDRHS